MLTINSPLFWRLDNVLCDNITSSFFYSIEFITCFFYITSTGYTGFGITAGGGVGTTGIAGGVGGGGKGGVFY